MTHPADQRLTAIDQLRLHVLDGDTFDMPDPESLLEEVERLEAKLYPLPTETPS